jgi:Delta7-sterol 5-desaturase
LETFAEDILYNYSYFKLYGLAVGYFMWLYFGLGSLFLLCCKFLAAKKIIHPIETHHLPKQQIAFEIKHSVKSIFVFGFSIIPLIYLIRIDVIDLLPDTWFNVLLGISILTLWNEVHFYVVHRMLHQKFMMRHVHRIHHTSLIPTVFSVYCFHWFEAFLLSTVQLTIVPFIPFSAIAMFAYPIVSILLNFAGHCNYRFGDGKGESWRLFGTHHNQHHGKGRKNYGFALNFLDKLFSKNK